MNKKKPVRILVCGMSRSGSTLLVKMIRKYFKDHHKIKIPVITPATIYKQCTRIATPAKIQNRAPIKRAEYKHHIRMRNFEKFFKRRPYLILKVHSLEAIQNVCREPRYEKILMDKLNSWFWCKRDARDASCSEIISIKTREDPDKSLDHIRLNVNYDEIKKIFSTLKFEYDSWGHLYKNPEKNIYEWKYENLKENEISTFANVFNYLGQQYDCVEELENKDLKRLLSRVSQPVDIVKTASARSAPEKYAMNAAAHIGDSWKNRDDWDVGVSSTGGKVGYHKEFLSKDIIKNLNSLYSEWLTEHGYI